MSHRSTWLVRGAIGATGIVGAMAIAACGGDDGATSSSSSSSSGSTSSSSSSGSPVAPQGPCNGKPVNDCGGCAELPVKVGTICAGGYNVCKGSDGTECKAGDGPPVTALTATTNLQDKVSLSWTAPTALTPSSYIVSRDGVEVGAVSVAKFDDTTAEAAKLVAPSNVQASDGTATDKVTVTWTAASSLAGKAHKYTVVPLYTQSGSALKGLGSNEATGNRAADVVTGYEVQRDGGQWVAAGTGTSYDDKDGPVGALVGSLGTEALSRGPSAVVFRVNLASTPVVQDVAPSSYAVRAKTAGATINAANGDTGFRKKPVFNPATATIKWQRSSGDGASGYVDIAGQTFSQGMDLAGATDGGGRFYRPVLVIDGVSIPGTAARATASAFKSVQLFTDNGCGVRTDDTVACWGNNNNNVVAAVPAGLKAKKVVVGPNHACAIKTDDNGVCWGFTGDNRSTVPAGVIKDMAVSNDSSCFIKADDTLQCSVNVAAPPGGTFKRIYRGTANAFCATKTDDTTACWGNNASNIVGNTGAYAAVKFKTLGGGQDHFCGITDADKLLCWGFNDAAPNLTSRTPFVGTPSVDTYKSLSVGWENTCATRADDTVDCWGLGNEGHFVGRSALKFKSLAHGNRMACGVDMNDRYFCLQSRNFNNPGPNEVAPQLPIANAKLAGGVGARNNSVCLVPQDGALQCFVNTPARTDQLRGANPASRFKFAETGNSVACGIRTDDTLECWGSRGSAPASSVTKYLSLSMAQSRGIICAVRQDNNNIECFNGGNPPAGTFKQVAVSQHQVCGIKTDDTIACGATYVNRYGQPAAPAGTFKNISPGTRRGRGGFCAQDMNNKLTCWGNAFTGPANPNDAFAAGPNTIVGGSVGFCGLLADGRRQCNGSATFQSATSFDKFDNLSQLRDTGFCEVRSDKTFFCEAGATNTLMPRFF